MQRPLETRKLPPLHWSNISYLFPLPRNPSIHNIGHKLTKVKVQFFWIAPIYWEIVWEFALLIHSSFSERNKLILNGVSLMLLAAPISKKAACPQPGWLLCFVFSFIHRALVESKYLKFTHIDLHLPFSTFYVYTVHFLRAEILAIFSWRTFDNNENVHGGIFLPATVVTSVTYFCILRRLCYHEI